MQIEITAEQFAWNIRYAGPDGKLDTADDIVTLNQLHFPGRAAGRRRRSTPRTSSTPSSCRSSGSSRTRCPACRRGSGSTRTRVGHWEIACAELCGLGHYRMKGFRDRRDAGRVREVAGGAGGAAHRRPRRPPAAPAAPAAGARRRQRKAHEQRPSPGCLPGPRPPPPPARTRPGVHPAPTSFWRKYIFSTRPQGHRHAVPLLRALHARRRRPPRDARPLAARLAGQADRASWASSCPRGCPTARCCRSSTTRSSRCTRRS